MVNLKCYTVGQFLFKFERVAWVTAHPFALYGHFPFSPKFQKFLLEIKWSRPFWFGLTRIFGTTLTGGPL